MPDKPQPHIEGHTSRHNETKEDTDINPPVVPSEDTPKNALQEVRLGDLQLLAAIGLDKFDHCGRVVVLGDNEALLQCGQKIFPRGKTHIYMQSNRY